MQDFTLLRTEKNQVFEMVLTLELKPNDFIWETLKEYDSSIREHDSTVGGEFVFSRLNYSSKHFFEFHPQKSMWSPGEKSFYDKLIRKAHFYTPILSGPRDYRPPTLNGPRGYCTSSIG